MSEAVNIPQLRFPEFNGAWEEKKLGEVVRYTKGFAFKSNDYVDSGVRIIRVSDLGAESIKKDNKSIYLSSENEHLYDKWKIRKNNIVITTVGSNPDLIESAVGRGIFIINDNEGLLNQNMLKLENSTQVNNKFVHCFINSPKYIHHIKAIKRGNANQANITVKELLDFKLSITTKPEQQKIAAFLNAVDTKIEQLSKKQALLSEYKKGLMQQIFSQAIRFKADDGIEFPEWEEKKLGGVVDNVGGTALEKYTNPKETHKFISIGNYGVDGKYIDNGQRVELNNKTKTKLLDKDNLVMVLNDKTAAGNIVGSTILIDESDSYIYNQRSERLICKSELFPIFAWHYLNSKIFRKSVYSISQGGTQIYVNFPSVKELNFSLPSLLEQTKIANFLSSNDTKIEQVGGQLDESKQFKKALLQQMFV